VQGDGIAITLKHFIAYGASEGGRNLQAVHQGPRELREVYGVPFEMAIAEGGARGVMSSYNTIDGVPVQASRELLTDLLRGDYGLPGVVMSDLGSVEQLHSRHGVSGGNEDSAVLSLRAGLDQDLAGGTYMGGLASALDAGHVSMEDIDRAAGRILAEKFRLGLFDNPDAPHSGPLETPEDRLLARDVAARSIVMLRNEALPTREPLLPLAAGTRSVAVIGPNANRVAALMGNYSYPVLARGIELFTAALDPTAAEGIHRLSPDEFGPVAGTGTASTVLEAMRELAPAGVEVTYARGCPIADLDTSGIEEAVALASRSSVAVVVVGDQAGLFTAATVGEGVDSVRCQLPGRQRELVEAIAATGTPTIVVLLAGRPLELGWMSAVPAIIAAWFPGEEGASALAEIIFGAREAGGRLPVSMPPAVGVTPLPYGAAQWPSYYDTATRPVFEFGHGLGYTQWEYLNLVISTEQIPTDGDVTISCTVRNVGRRAGEEVVQLYLHDPVARTSRPRLELKGFTRVALSAGDSCTVTFDVHAERTALFDLSEGWVVEPGVIEVAIGSSCERLPLRGQLEITGHARVVEGRRMLSTAVTVEPA
jgi:beta-glucosidase